MLLLASPERADLTRVCGLVAFGTASTCCAAALIRGARAWRQTERLAAVLLLIEAGLMSDIAFNWRWKIHQALMDLATREHEYGARRLPQSIALIILLALLLFGLFQCWRSFRHRGTSLLAVSGAVLAIIVWCVEVVSLHAVDHVLYTSFDGVMGVALLWFLSCGMTSIGILLDPR